MLEQYTSLTFTGHTRGNAMEPFLWSGGPIGAPKGPQMAKNDNFGAIRGCCGSALAEQCGIKVEQVRAHPGRCNGTVSMVRGPVLKIWFGPPNADFWSVWSSQKARKFRQIQPTTKVRIFCFDCPLCIKITIPVLVSVFNEIFNFSVSHLFVKYFFVLPVVCFLSTLVLSI